MIEARNLTIAHRGVIVLENVTFSARPGDVIILEGETGSGKTSMMRSLYGDLIPSNGSLTVLGRGIESLKPGKLPALRREMGLIFQDDRLLEDRTVYDNLRFALSIRLKDNAEINRLALATLADLGLSHLRSKFPDQLSGGEAQRIGIARALASSPKVIIADEPTGDLDPATADAIFLYLKEKHRPDGIMVLATHDTARATEHFPAARRFRISHHSLEEVDALSESKVTHQA